MENRTVVPLSGPTGQFQNSRAQWMRPLQCAVPSIVRDFKTEDFEVALAHGSGVFSAGHLLFEAGTQGLYPEPRIIHPGCRRLQTRRKRRDSSWCRVDRRDT